MRTSLWLPSAAMVIGSMVCEWLGPWLTTTTLVALMLVVLIPMGVAAKRERKETTARANPHDCVNPIGAHRDGLIGAHLRAFYASPRAVPLRE